MGSSPPRNFLSYTPATLGIPCQFRNHAGWLALRLLGVSLGMRWLALGGGFLRLGCVVYKCFYLYWILLCIGAGQVLMDPLKCHFRPCAASPSVFNHLTTYINLKTG